MAEIQPRKEDGRRDAPVSSARLGQRATPEGTSAPSRQKSRARSRRWIILLALLLVAVLALSMWSRRPEIVTATSLAQRDVVRTLVLTGRVRPTARPQIGATVSGTVRSVMVREGDRTTRGQVLLQLDDAQASAALAQAQAALSTATARAGASAEQARLAAESAQRDAERAQALFAQGAISQRDRDEAQRAAETAAAELRAASARGGNGTSAALAEVARARAAVDAAQAVLDLTRVRAPAAGVVLTRTVDPGDAVLPGQVLMELAADGATELVAFAREENLAELAVGASAVASADAFPDSSFAARVQWIAPVVDARQGTVEVRFAVDNPPAYLRADMTMSVNVEVERRTGALSIPVALVGDAATAAPWVMLARDGRAVRQPVRLGVRGDRNAEVLEGLTATDLVLSPDIDVDQRVKVGASADTVPAAR